MSVAFFIVGCGRSGTSLLRDQLNRHPRVAIPLESLFIVDYLRVADQHPLDALLELLVAEPEIREWGLAPSPADLAGSSSVAEAVGRLHDLFAREHGRDVSGQKTPRLVRHLPLLAQHFPDARFVHVVRDARAVVSSLVRSDVHRSTAYHGALRWRMDVSLGLAYGRANPRRTHLVRYEELVREPDRRVAEIVEFLGLPPAEASEPLGVPGDEYSEFYDRIHENLGRPPTPDFIDRWRDDLTERQAGVVEHLAGDLMEGLGYEREFTPVAPPPRLRLAFAAQRAVGMAGQTATYLRHRRGYVLHLLRRKARMGLLGEFLRGVNY